MDADKLRFINEELYEWAEWIDNRLREKMGALDIGVTEDLLRSLSFQVFDSSGLNDGVYKLSFLEYGRMVDMGAGRKSRDSIAENARAYRQAGEKNIRKPKKFYSKTTYGGLNRLISSLITGYQPAILNTLKEGLEQK